jgi:hypothetical protein
MSSPRFPSENPPGHVHLFFPLSGYSSERKIHWDGTSSACTVLWQLIKLNSQGQLSENVVKEWFSINVGNPEVLAAFSKKHNLDMKINP